MKADQQKQINYILDRLRKGKERAEILQEFTKAYKKQSTKTFDNRLKIARAQFESERQLIQQEAEKGIQKDIEALKSKILTPVERLVILSDMAKGELETEVLLVTKDGIKKAKAKPTHAERRAAIAELNKMSGDYAPAKSIVTVTKVGLDAIEEKYE